MLLPVQPTCQRGQKNCFCVFKALFLIFRKSLASRTVPKIEPLTMTALRLFFVGASVAAPLLAMLFLRLYNIDENTAYEVRQKLEERRGEV
jgi:Na+/melibiose symporter-like transporter